jgi:hypothetical protein
MNSNKTIVIVTDLLDRYDQAIDNGMIDCYLPGHKSFGDLLDYVNSKFYFQLENEISGITCSNNEEYRRIVLNKTFNILDNAELINGDMRSIYEKEFA